MKSKLLMGLAALLLLVLFVVPLWRITLEAPQYPDGITMYIWVNKITGDSEYTLQNINILNHYVGMKYIEPDTIPELQYFPYIVAGLVFFGVLIAFTKSKSLRLGWLLLLLVLGVLGIYDFYLWEYDYGNNLSPQAPIKVPGMVYQPPLFGSKMLLNFRASSYPHWGGIAMLLSMLVGFASYWVTPRAKAIQSNVAKPVIALLLVLAMAACTPEPQAITYGQDGCHNCKMTIVDSRFGAELVTNTGKVFKFDGVECLVNYVQLLEKEQVNSLWVTSYDTPGKLIEVDSCKYLISSGIKSPMGMNLSAFNSHQSAQSFQASHGGDIFNWQQIQIYLSNSERND